MAMAGSLRPSAAAAVRAARLIRAARLGRPDDCDACRAVAVALTPCSVRSDLRSGHRSRRRQAADRSRARVQRRCRSARSSAQRTLPGIRRGRRVGTSSDDRRAHAPILVTSSGAVGSDRGACVAVANHLDDEMRVEMNIDSRAITILECRPPFREDFEREWTRQKMVRMRYTKSTDVRTLYWSDRHKAPPLRRPRSHADDRPAARRDRCRSDLHPLGLSGYLAVAATR